MKTLIKITMALIWLNVLWRAIPENFFVRHLLLWQEDPLPYVDAKREVGDSNCDWKHSRHDLCYRYRNNASARTRGFNCNTMRHLDELGLLDASLYKPSHFDRDTSRIAFVTALYMDRFDELLPMVHHFRDTFNHTLVVYDLGARHIHRQIMSTWCNVEVRDLDYAKYPRHLKDVNLYEKRYRFKPIIIAELLKEYDAVWFVDTSVRFLRDDTANTYQHFENPTPKSPILRYVGSGHSTFAATHPGLYDFLPGDSARLRTKEMLRSDLLFVLRTPTTQEILKWWVSCALEEQCQAPIGARESCSFGDDAFADYANCHRYDHSSLDVLLANRFNYDSGLTMADYDGFVLARRQVTVTQLDFTCRRTLL